MLHTVTVYVRSHNHLPSPSTVASPARALTVTRVFQDGIELNWLPPTEPNGEVHYVVEYKSEDSGSWTSVNTTSDSTHYNLTGLHSGTNYTIRVVAVKGAGRTSNIPTASTTDKDDKRDGGGGSKWRLSAHILYIVIEVI